MAFYYDKQSGIVFADMDQYWDEFNHYSQTAETVWQKENAAKYVNAQGSPFCRRRGALTETRRKKLEKTDKKNATPTESKLTTIENELLLTFGYVIHMEENAHDQRRKSIEKTQYIEDIKQLVKQGDITYITIDEIDLTLSQDYSPRLAYLFQYYKFLAYKHKKRLDTLSKLNKLTVKRAEVERKKSFFFTVFDVGKKFIDMVDDICYPILRLLPASVLEVAGAILMGFVGIIIHSGEAYNGIKQAYYAYFDKQNKHRNLYLGSGVASFLLGGTGFSLSIIYGLSGIGLRVLGEALFPFLISAMLTGIYTVNLGKNIYLLRQAQKKLKDKETKYLKEYTDCYAELMTKQQVLHDLQMQRALVINNHNINPIIKEKKLCDIAQKEMDCQASWANLVGELQVYYQDYQKAKTKCYELKREISFNCIEVLASLITVSSILLGLSIMVTLGLPTLGVVPLTILTIMGILIGSGTKIFEKVDDNKEHRYSNKIADWLGLFKEKVNHFLGIEKQPQIIMPLGYYHATRKDAGNTKTMFSHLKAGIQEDVVDEKMPDIQIEIIPLKPKEVAKIEKLESSPKSTPLNNLASHVNKTPTGPGEQVPKLGKAASKAASSPSSLRRL